MQRLSALQLKSFNPASHGLAETKLQKCLLGVQTSHLLLMASNRNSICDIWSHKTINSDREIVNSTSRAVFPFQTSTSFQLQFWPPVSIGPNWEVCNGLQSVQLGVEDFYVTEMKISSLRSNRSEFTDQKGNGIAKKSTFEWRHKNTDL